MTSVAMSFSAVVFGAFSGLFFMAAGKALHETKNDEFAIGLVVAVINLVLFATLVRLA